MMDFTRNRSLRGFTLIELLIVVAIIVLLIAILLPSLAAARNQAKSAVCLSNLRSLGLVTQVYLNNFKETLPTRTATSSTGGGGVFGAFEPTRIILRTDKRPLEILSCPTDGASARQYVAGEDAGTTTDGLGIGTFYQLDPSYPVRLSYGINNMTGIKPLTDADRLVFNPNVAAYKDTHHTLLYADCAWVNARGHNTTINDAPKLKGRVGNAGAEARMDVLANIPDELGYPDDCYKRHPVGNNVIFMDHHAETVTQNALFAPASVLYSWSEVWKPSAVWPSTGNQLPPPPAGTP
jgi:prepilin-type N-terminal cleavage/methylation domain-containing protein